MCTLFQPKLLSNPKALAVPTENSSPMSPFKSDKLPTRTQTLREGRQQQRPKTVSFTKL